MLISLRLDPSGTYLQRLLENYLCEDLYILPFEEKDNKFVFRSEGIKISMNYNCKKTGPIISITMHINGIFYKKEKYGGLTLLSALSCLIGFERTIHKHLRDFSHLMYSEIYIYYVLDACGKDIPDKYKTDFRVNRYEKMLENLALVDKGEYPDPDAYRGLPIVRMKPQDKYFLNN